MIKRSLYDTLFSFSVSLASHARLFTLAQIARHPELSWRSLPKKRAAEMIRAYPDYFDKMHGGFSKPFRYRLSAKAKREFNLNYKSIDGTSSKSEHWLAIGDLWLALTFAGGRPDAWMAEPKNSGGFDVFCAWGGYAYLIEIQRTPLSKNEWMKKWKSRMEWDKKEGWKDAPWQREERNLKPYIAVITSQPFDKIVIPSNCIYAISPEDFVHKVKRKNLIKVN
jgi:hypothetical protein